MIRARFFARTALGLVVALGVAAGTAAPALAKDKDKNEKADAGKATANSKEFVTGAAALQTTLKAIQPLIAKYTSAADGAAKDAAMAELKTAVAGAPAQLTTAEAAIKTPGDRLLAGQWGAMIGSILGDAKLLHHAYQNILDSGVAPADQVDSYRHKLGNVDYSVNDYQGAIKALSPLVTSNYSDPGAVEMLADSYARVNQPQEGLKALKSAIDARKAANGAVPQKWYRRGYQIAYEAKLPSDIVDWSCLLVQSDPTPLNWIAAVQNVRDNTDSGSMGPQESLDLARLIFRNGAINVDKKYSEREYIEYLQDADPRRFPGEVIKVAEAGIKAGMLRANDASVVEALTQAKGRLVGDKASLPALEKDARAANATAATVMAAGDVFLSYDDPAKALEFYTVAQSKPGVDLPKALTRLGIAQYDLGRYADAAATFAKVQGSRKAIARMWSIQTELKAKAGS